MIDMTDDERQRIFDEAHATLDRLRRTTETFSARDCTEDDPLQAWARDMPQPEPEPRRPKLDTPIQALMIAPSPMSALFFYGRACRPGQAQARNQARADKKIEAEVGGLRAEQTVLRAVDQEKLTTLPDLKRRNG